MAVIMNCICCGKPFEPRALSDGICDPCRNDPNGLEKVNHPRHYGGDTPYEVIKVLEHWLTRDEFIGAMKFNVHKYLARANMKGGEEDAKKAAWYATYLSGFMERNGS